MTYEEQRHKLDTVMLLASNLASQQEQQDFVTRTFVAIHNEYEKKRVIHADYLKLVNRLAAFKGGAFSDYLDMLVGAAQMGMLELVMQGNIPALSPEEARKRRDTVTGLTGMQPIQPDEGMHHDRS